MSRLFNTNNETSTKKVQISPKRRRQRLGGILIIIWAAISLIEGFGNIINDSQRSWVFIVITISFCLIGGFFIYLSTRPDLAWEKENEEPEIEIMTEYRYLTSDDDQEDDPKKKYLE